MRLLRLTSLIALLAALALAGCGGGGSSTTAGSTSATSKTTTTPPPMIAPGPSSAQCGSEQEQEQAKTLGVPAGFHAMGDCQRTQLHARGITPEAPLVTELFGAGRGQCIDISVYQGHPSWGTVRAAGVRCVIVQASDGFHANPLFSVQVDGALASHLQVGVYIFAEGESESGQVATVLRVVGSHKHTAGAWVDAEVAGAYPVACGLVSRLGPHFHLVGVYGSPGTYSGGHCYANGRHLAWPACWGRSSRCPMGGYSSSDVVLQQWCGTCGLSGLSGAVDRDVDFGLLALSHSRPKPLTPHERLLVDYHARRGLNGELGRLNCLHGYDHYTRAHRDRCTSLRHRHGIVSRDIAKLHGQGVY